MHKPIQLLAAICCALFCCAQQNDTLVIYYDTDQFRLTTEHRRQLDDFLKTGWDRLRVQGFTDDVDADDYNFSLSRKRSDGVYQYLLSKNIPSGNILMEYFGETLQVGDWEKPEGKAANRRTVISGMRYPRMAIRPQEDPMKPLTSTLDNGFIVTYRPGTLPPYLANLFATGSGEVFRLLTNTRQMRQENLYNNTTRGEILSSVLIICNNGYDPCKLESPIEIKVPLPYDVKCPIENVKFFNAVAERGKRIWQEQSRDLYPEMINGRQYIRLLMDDLCGCINFDFKIDPDCFDVDSTRILYSGTDIRSLTAELAGLNSLYIPKKNEDGSDKLIFLKNKLESARLSFALYANGRRIRTFRDQPATSFPSDPDNNACILITDSVKFYFPKQKVWDVVLKVNQDRYRVYSDDRRYNFLYLKRNQEEFLVDITVIERKKKFRTVKDIPLSAMVLDPISGYYLVTREFLKNYKPMSVAQ